MQNKNTAVFGSYRPLISDSFSNTDVSVLMVDTDSTRQFAHQKATKAPEGTATGATAAGVVGGTLGLLAGLGALAIPGVGPVIAAGRPASNNVAP